MSSFFVKPEDRLAYPGTVVVRPLEHDASNTDVKLGQTVYTVIPDIKAAKVKPVSINNEPWTAFGSVENRVFIDDFCHKENLTVKAQASTYNGATIKVKEVASIDKEKVIKTKSEVKLWFPLFARMESALHLRLTSTDARVHYDHGLQKAGDYDLNLYGSFGFLRTFEKYNFKLGFALLNRGITADTRLKLDNDNILNIYHRTTGKYREFKFGGILGFNVNEKQLTTKKFLVGYEKDGLDVSVKLEQEFANRTKNYQDWKEWFNKYTLTTVFKRNEKERFGLEVGYDPKTNVTVGTLLGEYKYKDASLTRIKLDSSFNATILTKFTLTEKLAFSFGVLFPIKKENNKTENKYGIQLDLNI